ncbi:hypothetical protein D6D54_05270, partial [Spiroplasma poulsonii]
SLVACDNIAEYTPEELAKLKGENQINTTNQEIRDNLEWIAPQEKPFNKVDNKWYYVVWRGDKNEKWYLSKFNNNTKLEDGKEKNIDKLNNSILSLYFYIGASFSVLTTYISWENIKIPWSSKNNYIKAIYCWNSDKPVPDLIIDNSDGLKVKGE